MKICFVTTNFPRYLGDSEGTFIWEAARAVAKQGHQVRVIAQHWPNTPTHEWMEDVEVIRPHYWIPESAEKLRQPGGGLPIVWKHSPWARLQIIPFLLVHILTIARYARGFDVVHAQWSLSAGAAWLSRIIHRRPILATLQGSDIFQVTRSWIGRWVTRFVLKRCERISVLSYALKRATTDIGISASAITIVPNGVDISRFVPLDEERQPLIVYVGTLIKRKGVSYLIEAMAEVAQAHPHSRLVVVGEGPERASLEQLTTSLTLTPFVRFVGARSPEDVRTWMQRAKIFVLPSLEEGLGVVLLEALACGTPIVASNVGGIPDVVTPDVGVLTLSADSRSLSTAIGHLLAAEAHWQAMSKNARKRAEEIYDWQKIAEQFVTIYRQMVES